MQNYRYQSQDCRRGQQRSFSAQGMKRQTSCCAERKEVAGLSDLALAMAYVPWQEWREIYDLEKGFCCGTIFRELHKPFLGAGGRR